MRCVDENSLPQSRLRAGGFSFLYLFPRDREKGANSRANCMVRPVRIAGCNASSVDPARGILYILELVVYTGLR